MTHEQNVEKNYNDYTYRLVELKDEMTKAISNIKTVKAQQEVLCQIVEESNKAEFFKLFLQQSKEQLKNLDNQIETLTHRIELFERALKLIEEGNEEIRETTSLLLEALGVFNPEEKRVD